MNTRERGWSARHDRSNDRIIGELTARDGIAQQPHDEELAEVHGDSGEPGGEDPEEVAAEGLAGEGVVFEPEGKPLIELPQLLERPRWRHDQVEESEPSREVRVPARNGSSKWIVHCDLFL